MSSKPSSSNSDHINPEDDSITFPPLGTFTWIQGSPRDLQKYELKLCLMIQPNCPGCHQFALPAINELQKRQDELQVDMYILCTAFEDFEYNNVASAQTMVSEQILSDASKRALGTKSAATLYDKITLPMAHDEVVAKEQATVAMRQMAVNTLKAHMMRELIEQHRMPPSQVSNFLTQVTERMIPEQIAHAFTRVQARGTPTWVLYKETNSNHHLVLDQHLGPVNVSDLIEWIQDIRRTPA